MPHRVVLDVSNRLADAAHQRVLCGSHEEALGFRQQLGNAVHIRGDDDTAGTTREESKRARHEGFEDGDVEGLGERAGQVDVATALPMREKQQEDQKGSYVVVRDFAEHEDARGAALRVPLLRHRFDARLLVARASDEEAHHGEGGENSIHDRLQ